MAVESRREKLGPFDGIMAKAPASFAEAIARETFPYSSICIQKYAVCRSQTAHGRPFAVVFSGKCPQPVKGIPHGIPLRRELFEFAPLRCGQDHARIFFMFMFVNFCRNPFRNRYLSLLLINYSPKSSLSVSGPATPSTFRPFSFWKARTADRVFLPYTWSALPSRYPCANSASCSLSTSSPCFP